MANIQQRLPENVPGDFFVDESCIDCDTCSQLAPAVFRDHGEQCSVYRQPENEGDTRLALMALVACPTGSIGTTRKHDARIGIDAFPSRVAENVYFCGFTSEASFGGWSYLVTRPESEGGNLLIDSPRFATQLVKRIEALGGVRQMLFNASRRDRRPSTIQKEVWLRAGNACGRWRAEDWGRADYRRAGSNPAS